jgi:hypothetical protein
MAIEPRDADLASKPPFRIDLHLPVIEGIILFEQSPIGWSARKTRRIDDLDLDVGIDVDFRRLREDHHEEAAT